MAQGRDALGNPVSTADPALLAGLDDLVEGFLRYETRAASILKTAGADFPLANAYAGALFMLLESPQGPVPGSAVPRLLRSPATGATAREGRLHRISARPGRGDTPRAARACAKGHRRRVASRPRRRQARGSIWHSPTAMPRPCAARGARRRAGMRRCSPDARHPGLRPRAVPPPRRRRGGRSPGPGHDCARTVGAARAGPRHAHPGADRRRRAFHAIGVSDLDGPELVHGDP